MHDGALIIFCSFFSAFAMASTRLDSPMKKINEHIPPPHPPPALRNKGIVRNMLFVWMFCSIVENGFVIFVIYASESSLPQGLELLYTMHVSSRHWHASIYTNTHGKAVCLTWQLFCWLLRFSVGKTCRSSTRSLLYSTLQRQARKRHDGPRKEKQRKRVHGGVCMNIHG